MTLARASLSIGDPLLVALARQHPINADVLDLAITFREAQIDELLREIEMLKKSRAWPYVVVRE